MGKCRYGVGAWNAVSTYFDFVPTKQAATEHLIYDLHPVTKNLLLFAYLPAIKSALWLGKAQNRPRVVSNRA